MINFGKIVEVKPTETKPANKQVIQFGRVIDLSAPAPEPMPVKRQTLADLVVKSSVEPELINKSVNSKSNEDFSGLDLVSRKKLLYKRSSYLKDIWGD